MTVKSSLSESGIQESTFGGIKKNRCPPFLNKWFEVSRVVASRKLATDLKYPQSNLPLRWVGSFE